MEDVFRARVAKGAALLDERRPDWFTRVNLNSLCMSSCYMCVLGQLDQDKGVGFQGQKNKLHLGYDDAILHGFQMEDSYDMTVEEDQAYNRTELQYPGLSENFEVERFDYIILSAYWEDAIRERRSRSAKSR